MKSLHTISLLALLAGCTVGESPCDEVATEVGPSDPTSVGLTTEQVAASVAGTRTSTLGSHDADPTELTIEVNWTGEDATWVRRSPSDGEQRAFEDMAAEPVCVDALLLPVTLVFRTADGRFDETWEIDIEAAEGTTPRFSLTVDPDRLAGSWRPDVAGYADVSLEIEGVIAQETTSGVLRVRAVSGDGSPDETWDIAIWPAG